jgi:hypothetical protein
MDEEMNRDLSMRNTSDGLSEKDEITSIQESIPLPELVQSAQVTSL